LVLSGKKSWDAEYAKALSEFSGKMLATCSSGPPVQVISSGADLRDATSARRLVWMVLLLAIKDRATELQFKPSPSNYEWKLRCKLDGIWRELVPVPLQVPISQEIRKLSGLSLSHRLVRFLVRLARGSGAVREEHFRLLVAGHTVDLAMTIEPARLAEAVGAKIVALRLPEVLPSDEACRVLNEILESESSWSPPTQSFMSHACRHMMEDVAYLWSMLSLRNRAEYQEREREGILIKGSPVFVQRTEEALTLLQRAGELDFVRENIRAIRQARRRTYVDVRRRLLRVDAEVWSDPHWYAGHIAFETYRVALFREAVDKSHWGITMPLQYRGYRAHKECRAFQLSVLSALDAPEWALHEIRSDIANCPPV
jgi:hypothetical protein